MHRSTLVRRVAPALGIAVLFVFLAGSSYATGTVKKVEKGTKNAASDVGNAASNVATGAKNAVKGISVVRGRITSVDENNRLMTISTTKNQSYQVRWSNDTKVAWKAKARRAKPVAAVANDLKTDEQVSVQVKKGAGGVYDAKSIWIYRPATSPVRHATGAPR